MGDNLTYGEICVNRVHTKTFQNTKKHEKNKNYHQKYHREGWITSRAILA